MTIQVCEAQTCHASERRSGCPSDHGSGTDILPGLSVRRSCCRRAGCASAAIPSRGKPPGLRRAGERHRQRRDAKARQPRPRSGHDSSDIWRHAPVRSPCERSHPPPERSPRHATQRRSKRRFPRGAPRRCPMPRRPAPCGAERTCGADTTPMRAAPGWLPPASSAGCPRPDPPPRRSAASCLSPAPYRR